MTRLERLGWVLKAVYCPWNKTCLQGWYWFDGEKQMFHKGSWLEELMNREPSDDKTGSEQKDS